MGLYIQSLKGIPEDASRDYFIYLLDYGWSEPLSDALMNNYEKMAALAAENNSVVIRGMQRVHFEDEVLSWHHINGENAEEILPAILITNRNPARFRQSILLERGGVEPNLKLILIPIKQCCKTTSDVVNLIEKLFNDISKKKDLTDFRIARELKAGNGRSLADSLILEPNIGGVGISFNKLIRYFSKKRH